MYIISVFDIDISAEKFNSSTRSSTNIIDVFIPANIDGYDDTNIFHVTCALMLLFMIKLRNVQEIYLVGGTDDLTFCRIRSHDILSFPFLE